MAWLWYLAAKGCGMMATTFRHAARVNWGLLLAFALGCGAWLMLARIVGVL
jgi:hypothetical protein